MCYEDEEEICSLYVTYTEFFSVVNPVSAHPGRTDKNGGHTCRTNCEKWGLKPGEYHYHNGGSSNSSPQENPSTKKSKPTAPSGPTPAEKAAIDKNKGYEDGYKLGLTDGYENTTSSSKAEGTNAYIDGYNEGYSQGHKEGKAKRDKEEEDGYEAGYQKGLSDGYDELTNSSEITGADAYIKGYEEGYDKGYDEGKEKREKEKDIVKKEGYELGLHSKDMVVPIEYQSDPIFKEEFKKGFKSGREETFNQEKNKAEKLGYEDGFNNKKEIPKNLSGALLIIYQNAYKRGQEEIKGKYLELGYIDAYKKIKYEEPNYQDEDFINWYKEGFESNENVKDIQELAFEMGKTGQDFEVPKRYKQGEIIFKHYYELGEKERKKSFYKVGSFSALIAMVLRATNIFRKKSFN